MSETWYRGQSTQAPPSLAAAVGGHDLGDGVYYTNDMAVADEYAATRVFRSGGQKQVLQVSFDRAELGRVLDLTVDARWQKYLNTPALPGRPDTTPRALIIYANQNYPRMFQSFVAQEKIPVAQYDAIIAEEFVRGGLQLCICHRNGQPSQLAGALQARWQPAGTTPATKPFSITGLTFRPSTGPGDPAGFENWRAARNARLANTEQGWAMLGVALGSAIQALGDYGIRRQVRSRIDGALAPDIAAARGRGFGVLIIIRIEEWAIADFNDMRARSLLGVDMQAGRSPDEALATVNSRPGLSVAPEPGWRMQSTQYMWLD